MLIPFEESDGSPTEDTLALISRWEYGDGWTSLMEYITPYFSKWGRVTYRESDKVYEMATGGWSGNEDIILALKGNMLFWHTAWVMTARGGYYEFEVK